MYRCGDWSEDVKIKPKVMKINAHFWEFSTSSLYTESIMILSLLSYPTKYKNIAMLVNNNKNNYIQIYCWGGKNFGWKSTEWILSKIYSSNNDIKLNAFQRRIPLNLINSSIVGDENIWGKISKSWIWDLFPYRKQRAFNPVIKWVNLIGRHEEFDE